MIRNGGTLELESSTIVAPSATDVVYSRLNEFRIGGGFLHVCGGDAISSRNTLLQGVCDCVLSPEEPMASMTSLGGNLQVGADTCGLLHPTDQVNVTAAELALGPLANNGGPTATHALLPGSVAIDAGVADCPPVDQRGVPRPQGHACDTGAYEVVETLDIDIDIEPGNPHNTIHPKSDGWITGAILGSAVLDVSGVDAATLEFGPDAAPPVRGFHLADLFPRHRYIGSYDSPPDQKRPPREVKTRGHPKDVNHDGFMDLIFWFRMRDTGITHGDDEACLDGALQHGQPFAGCDAIRTLRGRFSHHGSSVPAW
jgi:hypothetical protein